MSSIPIVLTIAGSDSGGGAGIQADLKSMSANRVYAASVITALTAQNTQGVDAIHDVPTDFIRAQMNAVFSDLDVDAVKVGMLSQSAIIDVVADGLANWKARNIVVDPVMVAASGDPLIADEAVETLKRKLFPLATLVTPNLHEAARLTAMPVAGSDEEVRHQALLISRENQDVGVLVKGGHTEADTSRDFLVWEGSEFWFESDRIDTSNTHGTGCSLSSAIAANLAQDMSPPEAVEAAKDWLTRAISAADALNIGKGHGPVHHFIDFWKEAL
ncbi:MAG: bifunctional hydroxymethylpyrimidine kinase/phosphomethylpyrimidine kinase [Pseudomonadota bacterium]